jgi:hypothetical protein
LRKVGTARNARASGQEGGKDKESTGSKAHTQFSFQLTRQICRARLDVDGRRSDAGRVGSGCGL